MNEGKLGTQSYHGLLSLALLAAAGGMASTEAVARDYYGAPTSAWTEAQPETSINTDAGEGCPIETADGLSLMIASTRPGGAGGLDIWSADRPEIGAPFGPASNLGGPINTPAADFCPSPVLGNYLLFVSDREAPEGEPPVCGGGDMYIARLNPAGEYGEPRLLGCAPEGPNSSGPERSPWIVETRWATYLFYSSTGGEGDHDIYVSRMRRDGTFGPGRVIQSVSSESNDFMPNVRRRADGRFEMVFNSDRPTWGRKDLPAYGDQDVYYTTARWPTWRWTTPQNLGPNVNTAAGESRSSISTDGERLHFGRSGDIYVSDRVK